MAAQAVRGITADRPIAVRGHQLLVVGDPGEMDASQYVLLRELLATEAKALLLMSDVVYPAGNINAWRDAVYLPYFALPRAAWDKAVRKWSDEAGGQATPIAVPEWDVFAMPGNHDWYDGLTGFMYHAAMAEPLPPVTFNADGLSARQALSRRLWQRSTRPERDALDTLRTAVANPDHDGPGAMPQQPGPYFAIDLQRDLSETQSRTLRIVCVDTGIDGSIDVGQAGWLCDRLKGSVPKVVVTGKPIVVDGGIHTFPIEGGDYLNPDEAQSPDFDDLRDIIAEGDCVVACVAGDIHNAQRVILPGTKIAGDPDEICANERVTLLSFEDDGETITIQDDREDRQLPPLHIVAGGGGAYLTATHGIKFDSDGGLALKDHAEERADVTIPRGRHRFYPTREESVELFANNVPASMSGLAMALVGVGLAVSAWLVGTVAEPGGPGTGGDDNSAIDIETWRAVLASFVTAIAALLGIAIIMVRRERRKRFRVPAALTAAIFVYSWWFAPASDMLYVLGGAALAVLLPVLLFAGPLVRAYPSLRRLIPVRPALAALAAVLLIKDQPALLLFAALGALVGLGFGLRKLVICVRTRVEDFAVRGEGRWWRRLYLGFSVAVPGVIAVWVLWRVPSDEVLGLESDVVELIHAIATIELFAAACALAFVIARAMWKSRRVAPWWLTLPVLAGLGGGYAVSQPRLDSSALNLDGVNAGDLLLVPSAAVGAVLAAIAVCILIGARGKPSRAHVAGALKARDVRAKAKRGLVVFRAMSVAHLPGIGQLAESTAAPFYKSFLTIELLEMNDPSVMKLQFDVYGVEDEREPDAAGHPVNNGRAKCGSYRVDRVVLRVPVPTDEAVPAETSEAVD